MDINTIILAATLLPSLIVIIILNSKRKKAIKSVEETYEELQSLKARVAPLWKYRKIDDAEKEAVRIRSEAEYEVLNIINQAKKKANNDKEKAEDEVVQFINQAEEEAKRKKEKAEETLQQAYRSMDRITNQAEEEAKSNREEAKSNKEKAEETLQQVYRDVDRIINQANNEAKNIAGDALDAKGKAVLYEKEAKAMRNIIEGYGDEYLIATRTLLDVLAEEFSHKEGGIELKNARIFTKNLVKNERAATCDYVEEHRRTTAIRFVLDAFNGKVDTALSKVKHDNFGKLEQEIEDAFALVNGEGKAFRNARITMEYLNARHNELKWAVITQELKLQEREEQRRIKEAMREEERARREIEKAIRESEKEEKMLQNAMEVARQQLKEASEEQRQQYEDQLEELQKKLEEAEIKNKRALSMAQQTRRGHVYVISNIGSFGEDIFKIGLTRRLEPLDRVKELGDSSVPFEFDVHAMIYAEDAPSLEKELHRQFDVNQVNKVNPRKEFFKVTLKNIRDLVDSRDIEAHWTMIAEAREYRESMALEQKISNLAVVGIDDA